MLSSHGVRYSWAVDDFGPREGRLWTELSVEVTGLRLCPAALVGSRGLSGGYDDGVPIRLDRASAAGALDTWVEICGTRSTRLGNRLIGRGDGG